MQNTLDTNVFPGKTGNAYVYPGGNNEKTWKRVCVSQENTRRIVNTHVLNMCFFVFPMKRVSRKGWTLVFFHYKLAANSSI